MTRLHKKYKLFSGHKPLWIILVGILAAFACYLYQIDAQSLWRDEALSIGRAKQAVDIIFTNQNFVGDVAGPDLHPPLYFLFLHGWHKLVGESEFAWRYASALSMVLALAMFYAVGNRIGGRGNGRWAFLLALLSPFFLWYAQEARMYALVIGESLAVLLATWTLLHQNFNWKNILGFTLSLSVLVLTHYSGLFLAAFAVMAVGLAQVRRRFSPALLFIPLVGGLAVLWLLLPYVRELLQLPGFVTFSQRPLWDMASEAINTFSLGSTVPLADPGWRIWPFLILGLVGVGNGLYQSIKRQNQMIWFLAGFFIVPLLLVYLAALLQANYSNPRHLTILSAAWFLLMGHGLATLYRRWPPLALMAFVFAGLAGGGALYQTITDPPIKKDDVRGVAAYIEERALPGDLVVWHSAIMMEMYEYYAPDVPYIALPLYGQADETAVLDRLAHEADQFERIWFVEKPSPFFFNSSLIPDWLDARLLRTDFKAFAASWSTLQLRLYAWPQPSTPLPADYWAVDLVEDGYRIDAVVGGTTAVSGQGTWLSVIWSPENPNAALPVLCLQLRDSNEVIWADGCTQLDQPDDPEMAGGKPIASQLWLKLPPGLAPTTYSLNLLLNDKVQPIGTMSVSPPASQISQKPLVEYENGLSLMAIEWEDATFQAGLWALGNLVWQTNDSLPNDLIVSMRLVDWLGRPIVEEIMPVDPVDYPGDQWQPGEWVRSFIGLQLPFVSNGRYRVQVMVKDKAGTAVPAAGLFNQTWTTIDTLAIKPWPIMKELPDGTTPVNDVQFGETIHLLGYDMVVKNELLTIKLYWSADRETAVDYDVFVHLGQPAAPPLAQSSGEPANWMRPVSSWRPDEIIEDVHTIPVPANLPADAVISVGLFDSNNSDTRLPVTANDQPIPNNIWTLVPFPHK